MSHVEVQREKVRTFGKERMLDVVAVSSTRLVIEGVLLKLARAEHEWDVDIDDPEAFLRALRQSGRRVDLFTFAQRLPHTDRRFTYHTEWINIAAIPISTFERWWMSPIVKETRNKVRKSQKAGVEIRVVALDDGFVEGVRAIYNESPTRQGTRMVHYGKDAESIKQNLSTFSDRSDFIGAYYKGELIGFLKLVFAGSFTRTMHIMSALRHRDKAPTNALVAKAVELCADRGIPYLVYGQFDYGKRGSRTLTEFKRYTGFERIEVPRYYVPLTALGRQCLRWNAHQGIAELLPQRVVDQLLKLRGHWYRLRYRRHTANGRGAGQES